MWRLLWWVRLRQGHCGWLWLQSPPSLNRFETHRAHPRSAGVPREPVRVSEWVERLGKPISSLFVFYSSQHRVARMYLRRRRLLGALVSSARRHVEQQRRGGRGGKGGRPGAMPRVRAGPRAPKRGGCVVVTSAVEGSVSACPCRDHVRASMYVPWAAEAAVAARGDGRSRPAAAGPAALRWIRPSTARRPAIEVSAMSFRLVSCAWWSRSVLPGCFWNVYRIMHGAYFTTEVRCQMMHRHHRLTSRPPAETSPNN